MRDLERITALVDGDALYRIEIPESLRPHLPMHLAFVARGGLRIIAADEPYLDGRFGNLRHVSFSRPSILPSWRDVRLVKDTFYGDDAEAMLILPKAADYINIHPYTHHLWQIPEPWTDAGPILGGPHATIVNRREAVHPFAGRPEDLAAGAGVGPDGDDALEAEPVQPPGGAVGPVYATADGGGLARAMPPLIET